MGNVRFENDASIAIQHDLTIAFSQLYLHCTSITGRRNREHAASFLLSLLTWLGQRRQSTGPAWRHDRCWRSGGAVRRRAPPGTRSESASRLRTWTRRGPPSSVARRRPGRPAGRFHRPFRRARSNRGQVTYNTNKMESQQPPTQNQQKTCYYRVDTNVWRGSGGRTLWYEHDDDKKILAG